MTKPIFLGIDAGTTRIKAALIDMEGNRIDQIGLPVEVYMPFEGACETDMIKIWEQVCRLTRSLASRNSQIWGDIVGVGITGQGDGLWPVDKAGEPVRNAVLWNDTRVKHMNIENRSLIEELCVENSVTPIFSGSAPLLLKWLKENEQDNFKRISYVLHCKDWLNFKLTGIIATDYTDASTAVMNIFSKKYIRKMLDALNIGRCIEFFPEPVASTTIIGTVTKEASEASSIMEGVPVIAGAIDVAAAALGAGLKETGEACSIVGTTLCNELVLGREEVDHTDTRGSMLCHIVPDKYLRVMAALSGTSTLDWVRKTIAPELSFQEIEKKIKEIPLGSGGIIFHPYLYGERAPFKNPFASGGFFGLSAYHTKFHILRASYEGIALSLLDCYNYLPQIYSKVYISGGGSESNILCQMVADCLGKPVIRPLSKELGIDGIVKTLKVGLGYIKDFSSIHDDSQTVFMPDRICNQKYKQLYKLFIEIQKKMEGFWENRLKIV